MAQLSQFNDGLDSIKHGIVTAATGYAQPQQLSDTTIDQLQKIISGLRAVPVEVDINVLAGEGEDDIESIEKTSRKAQPKIDIEPEVRQGE